MTDDRPTRQTDFIDQQRELSGANGARIDRFFGEDGASPRARAEKARKAQAARAWSRLAELLQSPSYAAAFEAVNNAIGNVQAALDQAIEENAKQLEDMESRAVKLEDGRAVFLRKDGRGETKDGEIIPLSVMQTLQIPADAPGIDAYNAARQRRRELGEYSDHVDNVRREVNDPDNPMQEDQLKDVIKDIEQIQSDIEGRPPSEASATFEANNVEENRALDLSIAPVLGR